ncbi:MAG TPA: hypothetical protein VK468_06070 [Pyrinomonadaceae bacterium]|nr:hypothetical protein [Pyrinomonadaceae bacterium]
MKIVDKLALLLFLVSATSWNVLAQAGPNQTGRFSDLSLKITSPRESYLLLEPIPVIFQLRNNTNGPIAGHGSFRFSCSAVEMFVRNPMGQIQTIRPLSLYKARCVSKDHNIPPRAQTQYTELLNLDLNRYFVSTGIYGIQAVFHSANGPELVRSPWLTISVTQPEGNSLAAYEFLKQGTDLSRVFVRHETEEQRTFFEAFLANYADSPYSPYIRFNLAEYYMFSGDWDKAKAKLNNLSSVEDFVFASKVAEMLKGLETKQKSGK